MLKTGLLVLMVAIGWLVVDGGDVKTAAADRYDEGGCNSYGCYPPGGGCNAYGCWDRYGGCNAYGCWSNGGGCNAYGCWHSPRGSCNAYGCSNTGTCNAYGCPPDDDDYPRRHRRRRERASVESCAAPELAAFERAVDVLGAG